MNKNELLTVLDEGLSSGWISKSEYDEALHLYSLIYEIHTASEASREHETLASIINKASGTDEETLKAKMREEYMTSADLQYIREQEEKAKQQITGENERTARRKLMRSWEEEKNTANRCIKPLSEKQLLKQIDHSLSQAGEVRDAEEFEAEFDAELNGTSTPVKDM